MRSIVLLLLVFLLPVLANAQQLSGKAIYVQRCQTCHQADGAGAQNMVPPLIKTEQVIGNKAKLIRIVLHGLNGEIKVNGDLYAGEMPAHSDLKDSEIAAVLTFVRNNFGNKASAVRAAEVKKVRAENKK